MSEGKKTPAPSAPRTGVIVVADGPVGTAVAFRVAKTLPTTLVVPLDSTAGAAPSPPGLRLVRGDASSLLVLREARAQEAHALVAATSRDDVNIEASRLASALGVPEVVCQIGDAGRADEVLAMGAQPVTAAMALSNALAARLPGVVVTTSEVGLGEGEILQVRVMPGSLVIGRPLHEIATRAYLVAAIYRGGRLVVPHGDTRVEAGDQVLLVGQPDTLGAVADYFRLGAAQFPRQFGRAILVWNPRSAPSVEDEARLVADQSRCGRLLRVVERGAAGAGESVRETGEIPVDALLADPLAPLPDVQPGLFVLAPPARTRLGLLAAPGPLREILDRTLSPVLLARGTAPYSRILAPITDSPISWRGLELAVDIARMVDGRITVLHAARPSFLAGPLGDERRLAVERNAEQVARLYRLPFEIRVVGANPITAALSAAEEHDLVVVARQLRQPDTYFKPDVGLRIATAVRCSAVLLTVA